MINNIDLTIYSPYNASLMLAVNNLSEDFWLNVKEYSNNPNYSFFGYAFGGGSAKDIQNPDKWILIKDTDLLSIRPSENPNATPDSVYEWDVFNGLVIGLKDDQFELFDYYKIPFRRRSRIRLIILEFGISKMPRRVSKARLLSLYTPFTEMSIIAAISLYSNSSK